MAILVGCEIDTRVRVTKTNPPKFTFSGNGHLAQLYVSGPFTLEELKLISGKEVVTKEEASRIRQVLGGDRILWQIDPGRVYKRVSEISAITYGKMPEGFRQIRPNEGNPLQLLEGKYYCVYVPSYNAGSHSTCFQIQDGKALEISDDQL